MYNGNLFKTPEEAFDYIRLLGAKADDEVDIAEAAIAMGLLFLPGISVDRYRSHLKKMLTELQGEFNKRIEAGEEDSLSLHVELLRHVVNRQNDYKGDSESYDDIQNANLIRVIERRKGLPVALGVIYISLAQKTGWECKGLSFPGHFLIRMEMGSERVILDPFEELAEMNAADLRELLKSIVGSNAELSHDFYTPVSNRDVLLRLQNNLKKRFIDMEDYTQAVRAAESIKALCPNEYRIHFDIGILYAKLGNLDKANEALEKYISTTPDNKERHQAELLLAEIRLGL